MMNDYQIKATKQQFDPRYYILTDNQQQIPYKHYGTEGMIEDIKIIMDDQTTRDLPEVSEIVDAIVKSKRKKTDQKIYFPKELK